MNHKVVEFFVQNPDILNETKSRLQMKRDQIVETDMIFFYDIDWQFKQELIYQTAKELSRQTGESVVDCVEVVEFYFERTK